MPFYCVYPHVCVYGDNFPQTVHTSVIKCLYPFQLAFLSQYFILKFYLYGVLKSVLFILMNLT